MVRYLKRLKSSKFVRVKAFPMYGGIGVSAPSLHRESTDSLILARLWQNTTDYNKIYHQLWGHSIGWDACLNIISQLHAL